MLRKDTSLVNSYICTNGIDILICKFPFFLYQTSESSSKLFDSRFLYGKTVPLLLIAGTIQVKSDFAVSNNSDELLIL